MDRVSAALLPAMLLRLPSTCWIGASVTKVLEVKQHGITCSYLYVSVPKRFGTSTQATLRCGLQRKEASKSSTEGPLARTHEVTWPLHMLPPTVDWRGSGADSVVKDQAMCGSCWAFAAIAPMETAYYQHFGEHCTDRSHTCCTHLFTIWERRLACQARHAQRLLVVVAYFPQPA